MPVSGKMSTRPPSTKAVAAARPDASENAGGGLGATPEMTMDADLHATLECEESVIEKIRQRRDRGREKYGTTMEREDLTPLDWMRHAQEEAMDFAIYLERLIRETRP